MANSAASKLLLDYVYGHESALADQVYLTQPLGKGVVVDYTWRQLMDQARRMATHLKSLGLEPGARIAILSKNTAHFIMAELAIWMSGHTTVAIFPTESAETVKYVLEHSGASLLFVGKLAPLCSSTYFTVSADSVGKMATVVLPDIQMASSAMMKCAVFLDKIATRAPGSSPRDFRCVAMRRAWSIIWRQV